MITEKIEILSENPIVFKYYLKQCTRLVQNGVMWYIHTV